MRWIFDPDNEVVEVAETEPAVDHTLTINGLEPPNEYAVEVQEIDLSGSRLVNDNPQFE